MFGLLILSRYNLFIYFSIGAYLYNSSQLFCSQTRVAVLLLTSLSSGMWLAIVIVGFLFFFHSSFLSHNILNQQSPKPSIFCCCFPVSFCCCFPVSSKLSYHKQVGGLNLGGNAEVKPVYVCWLQSAADGTVSKLSAKFMIVFVLFEK